MVAGVASRIAKQGIGQLFKRGGRIYLHTTFGTGVEAFERSMKGSIFGNNPPKGLFNKYRNSDWHNFGNKFKDALKAVEKDEEAIRKTAGGSYLKSLWKQAKGLWYEPKAAYQAAKNVAGKSALWEGVKGFGKAAWKRFPLIGGIMFFASSFPDIGAAFKEGGFVSGVCETVKSLGRVGFDMLGFAIGQALIPIPFVGGIIGSIVVGGLGSLIMGKPWRQKHAPENGQTFGGAGAYNQFGGTDMNATPKYEYIGWQPVSSGYSDAEIAALQRQYGNKFDMWY